MDLQRLCSVFSSTQITYQGFRHNVSIKIIVLHYNDERRIFKDVEDNDMIEEKRIPIVNRGWLLRDFTAQKYRLHFGTGRKDPRIV